MFRLLKLKPPHGWNAVGWELAIVTIGVLIALGAQEFAGTFNDAAKARDARQAIRSELELDMARLRTRGAQMRCVANRLTELQVLLDETGKNVTFKRPGWVGRPQAWTMQRARWDASSQAGNAALLPPSELAIYGSMYALMDQLNIVFAEEAGHWARLRSLEDLDFLDADGRFDLIRTLREARYLNWRVNTWSRELEDNAALLKLRTVKNDLRGTASICVPLNTPTDEGLRLSQTEELWELGEP